MSANVPHTSYASCEAQAPRVLAKTGELFKEYQTELRRLDDERRAKAQQEEDESRPLLEQLEKEGAAADGLRRAEIERADRELAQRLQQDFEAAERPAPADQATIEADAKFARELQDALNRTSPVAPQEDDSTDCCATAAAAADGAGTVTATATAVATHLPKQLSKESPRLAKRRSGQKDDGGSRSKQPSLDAHVHVIGSDDSGDDDTNGVEGVCSAGAATNTGSSGRPRMQKCPMCAVAFVIEVLLEHAPVCNGPSGRGTSPGPGAAQDPSSGGSGSSKRKESSSGASSPPGRHTLDDFVVRSGKKHRGPDDEPWS